MTGKVSIFKLVVFFFLFSCERENKEEDIKVDIEKARELSQPGFDKAVREALDKKAVEENQ
jgi:hypothetical protein